ncbi:hypothetical protein B0H14DRAFT_3022298, partial [Mycena olivaceomarginata]
GYRWRCVAFLGPGGAVSIARARWCEPGRRWRRRTSVGGWVLSGGGGVGLDADAKKCWRWIVTQRKEHHHKRGPGGV